MSRLLRFQSVRARITVISTVLVAVVLGAASMILVQLVENDLRASAGSDMERALHDMVDEAMEAAEIPEEFLGIDPFGGASGGRSHIAVFGDIPLEDRTFFVASSEGKRVSLAPFDLGIDGLAWGQMLVNDIPVADVGLDTWNDSEVVRLLEPFSGEPITNSWIIDTVDDLEFTTFDADGDLSSELIVGAQSLEDFDESVAAVRGALAFTVPALVLAFAMLTWWLVGRALRPVHQMTERVASLSMSNLDERLAEPATTDEIGHLARVMNAMLARLDAGNRKQRRFSADASHELRSPLSSVRAAAELISLRPEHPRVPRLADDIVAETDRMDQLIGDLLLLARMDATADSEAVRAAAPVDLPRLLSDRLPSAANGLPEIQLLGDAIAFVPGPNSLVWSLIRNLVDNAQRHASQHVQVRVEQCGEQVIVQVDDDGPGIPPADRDAVFERFHRLDDARTRDQGGSGLGLALVKDGVATLGGSVTVTDSPRLGGARFVLALPKLPAPHSSTPVAKVYPHPRDRDSQFGAIPVGASRGVD